MYDLVCWTPNSMQCWFMMYDLVSYQSVSKNVSSETDEYPWIFLKTSLRSAHTRRSSSDHSFNFASRFSGVSYDITAANFRHQVLWAHQEHCSNWVDSSQWSATQNGRLSLLLFRPHLSTFSLSLEVPACWALQLCIHSSCFSWNPSPDWRRPPGRPHRMWLKQVEEDVGQPVSSAQITAIDQLVNNEWVSEWVLD